MATPEEEGKIDALRERLYSRSGEEKRPRSGLRTPTQTNVPRNWQRSQEDLQETLKTDTAPMAKKKRGYRTKILMGAGIFFGVTLLLSLLFLLLGNNSISGDNISLEVSGPFAIGGAETVDFRVALENNNAVPIESATLIIEYPVGTQNGEGRELFTERVALDVISAGQLVSKEFSAMIFGEENAEKLIKVSVEYRVRGSNAVFYKEAEPLRLKISSSPIVLSLKAPDERTSGQDMDLELTVVSNSEEELTNVLVQADYPFGFEFTDASPRPDAGNDTWRIESLEPGEETIITVLGVMTGLQKEERVFTFSAGAGTDRSQLELSSVYATAEHEVDIDGPALNVDVDINGSSSSGVVLQDGQSATVRIDVLNTLGDTLHNTSVAVVLGGNILDQVDIDLTNGEIDRSEGTIYFDSNRVSALRDIPSGALRSVSFTLTPESGITKTSQVTLDVTVRGYENYNDDDEDALVQNVKRTIQLSSNATLSADVQHISGPSAPKVGETTRYGVDLLIQNGSNQLVEGVVTAVLPENVVLDNEGGNISYDAGNRRVSWNVGTIGARGSERMTLFLSITPDSGDRGNTPRLLEVQRLSATNKFTGLTVRAENGALAVPKRVE